jgi:hypothetical protein
MGRAIIVPASTASAVIDMQPGRFERRLQVVQTT